MLREGCLVVYHFKLNKMKTIPTITLISHISSTYYLYNESTYGSKEWQEADKAVEAAVLEAFGGTDIQLLREFYHEIRSVVDACNNFHYGKRSYGEHITLEKIKKFRNDSFYTPMIDELPEVIEVKPLDFTEKKFSTNTLMTYLSKNFYLYSGEQLGENQAWEEVINKIRWSFKIENRFKIRGLYPDLESHLQELEAFYKKWGTPILGTRLDEFKENFYKSLDPLGFRYQVDIRTLN